MPIFQTFKPPQNQSLPVQEFSTGFCLTFDGHTRTHTHTHAHTHTHTHTHTHYTHTTHTLHTHTTHTHTHTTLHTHTLHTHTLHTHARTLHTHTHTLHTRFCKSNFRKPAACLQQAFQSIKLHVSEQIHLSEQFCTCTDIEVFSVIVLGLEWLNEKLLGACTGARDTNVVDENL